MARRYMHEFGLTREQLANVAVAARRNAARNPKALRREPITVEDVVASRLIADPLHALDCCLVSNFGGAVVVTTVERARDLDVRPVYVVGSASASSHKYVSQAESLTSFGIETAAGAAYSEAGIGSGDIDVAWVYDGFTITVLLNLEGLGFCERGAAGDFVAEQGIAFDGALPVNTVMTRSPAHTVETSTRPRSRASSAASAGIDRSRARRSVSSTEMGHLSRRIPSSCSRASCVDGHEALPADRRRPLGAQRGRAAATAGPDRRGRARLGRRALALASRVRLRRRGPDLCRCRGPRGTRRAPAPAPPALAADSTSSSGWRTAPISSVGYSGTARLGATLVPLHTRSTAREAGALFATTPPSAFIVGDGEGGPRPADVGEVLRHPALAEALRGPCLMGGSRPWRLPVRHAERPPRVRATPS